MMFTMRKFALSVSSLVLLAGCAGIDTSSVDPGDGPAATSAPTEAAKSTPPKPKQATFKDKYTYKDGLQVEVTKIGTKKLSEYAAVSDDSGKKGAKYTVLTVRVKNGTAKTVDTIGSGTVNFGPDGDEAPTVFDSGVDGGIDGKVLPGKTKSGTYGFLIPKKYLDDVVLEFSVDFDHASAVFAGSVG